MSDSIYKTSAEQLAYERGFEVGYRLGISQGKLDGLREGMDAIDRIMGKRLPDSQPDTSPIDVEPS